MRSLSKKIIIFWLCFITLGVTGLVKAEEISFIQYAPDNEALKGVDGNTNIWSKNDNVKNLGTSQWNLLNGAATVTANQDVCRPVTLTHRGTRGLGVSGGEYDEVDRYLPCRPENITVTFDKPYYLNSFEVRSLFVEFTPCHPRTEVGAVDFYSNNQNFFTQTMFGQEKIWQATKGIWSIVYDAPQLVDKLVFYVPLGYNYSRGSEFALAKLNVTAVPEPISTVLFISGGAMLLARRLRTKRGVPYNGRKEMVE